MVTHAKLAGWLLLVALTIGMTWITAAWADKPVKPDKPSPEEPLLFSFVDLLGVPGANSLQSDGQSISQPDETEAFYVAGLSRDADGWCSVIWHVAGDGIFAGPFDLGGPNLNVQAAVNDAGTVVTSSGHVFVRNKEPQELPALGALDVNARAINNNNQIVGWIVYEEGGIRVAEGALWTLDENGKPGEPTTLGDFFPKDISDTGVMAGEDESIAMAAIARFQDGTWKVSSLGTLLGFDWSMADAISSDGCWVAGTCRREGPWQAFLWSEDTGMIDLGSLAGGDSHAYDVNNAGQVVGTCDTNEGRYSMTAVLWDNLQAFDLNALTDAGNKTHLNIAKGINDAGQIVGLMHTSRPVSESHGYLLIPNAQ